MFCLLYCRDDNEKAYVSVNGKSCWSRALKSTTGSEQCGVKTNNWLFEYSTLVTCKAEAVDGKLKVRVHTDLNSNADDESFAIDNVVVKLATTITSNFNNKNDFEGWNCGDITSCGEYGNVCGGYKAKGKESEITKTFDVPAGTYGVTLDFIKIDSWCVLETCLYCEREWSV